MLLQKVLIARLAESCFCQNLSEVHKITVTNMVLVFSGLVNAVLVGPFSSKDFFVFFFCFKHLCCGMYQKKKQHKNDKQLPTHQRKKYYLYM